MSLSLFQKSDAFTWSKRAEFPVTDSFIEELRKVSGSQPDELGARRSVPSEINKAAAHEHENQVARGEPMEYWG